ncbi:MAG: helix-turn-helix domain-containing protein [Flavobacteriales bacterium]
MNSISEKIIETRKLKGYSQEELASLAKVNLRTIQRIENNENEPRGKTLNLIAEALGLNVEELNKPKNEKRDILTKIINLFFLLVLNLILAFTSGLLTLGAPAKLEIRTGAFLLSFFIPFFIVWKTQKLTRTQRILKFGSGYIFYLVSSLFIIGFVSSFVSCLLPCLIISLITLFYGNDILRVLESKND